MSARTSRRAGSSAHTPVVTNPSSSTKSAAGRSPSPLSPARVTRLDEKRSIQNLNDRLASYIDLVRQRDFEIAGLKQEQCAVEETHQTEIVQIKSGYSKEMAQLRKALDQIAKEKAKHEIEAEKAIREAKEAKSDLALKEKLLSTTDRELRSLQNKYTDLTSRLSAAEGELKILRPDFSKLQQKLEDAKRNLEDETLKRVDLQNQVMSLEESFKFENHMLQEQLNETRVRRTIEITEMDSRLHDEYERKLEAQLNEIRTTYEDQMNSNNEELIRKYEDKNLALQAKLDQERLNIATMRQESLEMSTKVGGFASKNMELEASNASLQRRMAEITKEMEDRAAHFRAEMARKDAEIKSKDEVMEATLKDYKDLMEIKVALDMEIAIYRKLIEGEEARLGMSPQGSPDSAASGGRGVKRKKLDFTEEELREMEAGNHTGKGTIFIEPIKKDAKAVKLSNKLKESVNLAGWILISESDGDECIYKFPRNSALGPEESCTVWSSDSQQDHSPPANLVMKKGSWKFGMVSKTRLLNKEGEEEACRQVSFQQRHSVSYLTGYRTHRPASETDGKCAIM